ncbi:MAG TPA: response regulator [Candidatus Angelobacter sp.]
MAESKAAVILCVDDEPNALILRKLVLQKAGHEVVTANSAFQALDVLTAQRVDLVLSDQLMPGQTGTELARQIKSKWPSLPVILLSGVNEIPPDAEIADLFLSKVEGPVSLCQRVNDILNRSRSL